MPSATDKSDKFESFVKSKGFIGGVLFLGLAFFFPAYWVGLFATGLLLIWGSRLILRKRKAHVWWYLGFGAIIAVSAWYWFDPEYFIDFTSDRSYVVGIKGGSLSRHSIQAFLFPMMQMVPFVLLGNRDGWIKKTHLWGIFFTFIIGCVLGAFLSISSPKAKLILPPYFFFKPPPAPKKEPPPFVYPYHPS